MKINKDKMTEEAVKMCNKKLGEKLGTVIDEQLLKEDVEKIEFGDDVLEMIVADYVSDYVLDEVLKSIGALLPGEEA